MIDYEDLQGVNKFFSNLCVRVICSVYERCLTNLGQGLCVCSCGIAVCADPPSGGKAETTRIFFPASFHSKIVLAKLIKVPFHQQNFVSGFDWHLQ